MKNKFCFNLVPQPPAISLRKFSLVLIAVCLLVGSVPARAGGPPQWMRSAGSASLPPHDDKTEAVLLYSETSVNVISVDKIKKLERRAYKILRPEGRDYGTALVSFRSPGEKVNGLRAWCIPAQGKDYEVRDDQAVEASLPRVDGSELINDVRVKILKIPAAEPGNIVGYEYELEETPLVLQDRWEFQHEAPTRESHYSLQLPAGWEYKALFLNFPEIKPVQGSNNSWQWSAGEMKEIRSEEDMPPGVEARMVVNLLPPGGVGNRGFLNWREMGAWYTSLIEGRREATPEIRQKTLDLTSPAGSTLQKMQAIAQFVQHDIRYVAIELGIGGYQPHPASETFAHRYGDCKDKTTLMSTMLHQIGVESFFVLINTERGSVTPEMPATRDFDHAIIAIRVPAGIPDSALGPVVQHPRWGKILFFDPTDEITPFGQISGALQANYGLLVTQDEGELIEIPKQSSATNSVRRSAKFLLDTSGTLRGDVEETRLGDRAWAQRWALRNVANDKDRIKPIERLLGSSLSNFSITRASVLNATRTDQPFGFDYSFIAERYAKTAGGLLLVRPRVLGSKTQSILETKEPRQYPIEFSGPVLDSDTFEITIPPGYIVDELPPPVDADFGFASYHSRTEAKGNVLSYSRTFEIKELSVPVSRALDLKKFYRLIATDERNTAVLKPVN